MKFFIFAFLSINIAEAQTIRSQAESMMKTDNRRANNADILEERLPNQVHALSMVDKIRSFEPEGGKFVVTFWDDNRVFRIPAKNAMVPCLENSFKSDRPVTLAIDQKTQTISQCKMFGGTHPGMRKEASEGIATETATGTGTGASETPDELESKVQRND